MRSLAKYEYLIEIEKASHVFFLLSDAQNKRALLLQIKLFYLKKSCHERELGKVAHEKDITFLIYGKEYRDKMYIHTLRLLSYNPLQRKMEKITTDIRARTWKKYARIRIKKEPYDKERGSTASKEEISSRSRDEEVHLQENAIPSLCVCVSHSLCCDEQKQFHFFIA
jgi:hypothetical protein